MKHNFAERSLISLNALDSLIEGWFGIWFVKIFTNIIDVKYLSANNIINSALGIVFIYITIKRFEKPTLKVIVLSWGLSYFSLFALLLSPGIFFIMTTLLGVFMGSITGAFRNKLYAINIPNCRRAQYDNYVMLIRKIGGILGGTIAYFTILPNISYKIIWIFAYVAFDIDLIITLILVNRKILAY